MFKHVLVLGLGAAILSAAALPQQASAQSMRPGFGQGGRAPEEFRMHGGQGQFGGGRGQFGRSQTFHNQFRPFGASRLSRGGSEAFRFHGEPGRFGGDRGFGFGRDHRDFRFAGDQRRFGGEGFRFDRAGRGFGYRDGFRVGGGFEGRRFVRPGVRYGYGYGIAAVRHYPAFRHGFRDGYGVGFARPYPVRVGYGFPGAGCTTSRTTSLTPAGWRKIVTVRVCYVR